MITSVRALACGALLSAAPVATVSAQLPMEIVEAVADPDSAGNGIDSLVGLIQTASSEDVREQRALDISEYLSRNFTSVFVNEAQSNPLQPDVRYRGFVASPLLGLPQGLAVYQDGVRINEPFGDTVNWALLPTIAVESVYLVPGSNPLFGLNSLGGALSLRTKSGKTHPGTHLSAQVGSHSRSELLAETGGALSERSAYYLSGSFLQEDGWRDFSPSRSAAIFGKLSGEVAGASLDVSLSSVGTDLTGNGAAPSQLLAEHSTAIFTRPDETHNDLDQLILELSREFSGGAALNIAAYLRRSDIETLNGDDSDFEACDDSSGFVCIDADDAMPVADTAGQLIVAAPELLGATINRTTTQQDGRGISLQIASPGAMETTRGRWLAGLSLDDGEIDFSGNTELGALDPTRRAVPGGAIVADSQTELQAASRSVGLYLAYTAFPSDSVSVSLSGRYNRTDVTLRDRLGTALDGDHEFSKLNPALGVTWEARHNLTLFASIGQSNRAPSPVELTCADADAPCRLPNAFLSDPPLEQVVARTAEAGLRGSWRMGAWNIGLFDTQTRDEILFISAGALTNQGFFANVGETRRRGIEGGIHGELDERLSWSLSYSLLDATFRSGFQVPSPNHPFANDGETTVAVGDRLPLTPERQFKASLRFFPTARFRVSGNLQVSSGAYFRGDEANEASELSEFAVVNVRASYSLTDSLSVFLKVDNLLDESYRTFGVFGQPDEVLGEEFDDPRFVSPGAPRSGWIGFEASF